jgi:hypothetical protein
LNTGIVACPFQSKRDARKQHSELQLKLQWIKSNLLFSLYFFSQKFPENQNFPQKIPLSRKKKLQLPESGNPAFGQQAIADDARIYQNSFFL